jgi:hypothetical protein
MSNVSDRSSALTGYELLFVGLICFKNDKPGIRPVLLPDGRSPGGDIEPHYPYVVVDPEFVVEHRGWEKDDQEVQDFITEGLFRLPPCTLHVSGIDGKEPLDTKQHDVNIPSLLDADPKARLSLQPNAVVRLTITSGMLQAFRRPGLNEEDRRSGDVAAVALLSVNHPGEIRVTVDGGKRVIHVRAGSDVAIANVAFPRDPTKQDSHFAIYGQLTSTGTIADNAPAVPHDIPELPGTRYVYTIGLPINDGTAKCGVIGCCKPGG